MTKVYSLPQTLTGAETVTIHQVQGSNSVKCTMPLSSLIALLPTGGGSSGGSSTAWVATLPTDLPDTSGILWNNDGVVSIS
jgi:hypothetical protein